MAVVLADRTGHDLGYWWDQPYAYAYWVFCQLQEYDRRQQWMARMERLHSAHLTALAFHEPNRIDQEHREALCDAMSDEDAIPMKRGLRLMNALQAGNVMEA